MKIAKEKNSIAPSRTSSGNGEGKKFRIVSILGQGLVYTIVSQCLMYYYTDSVLMAPAVVSIILAIGKVWDAVNDTLFGLIVDAVKFKSGHKFLPWLRLSTILIPLSTIALFCLNAGMSPTIKIVLAVVTYLLWDTCYTLCDAPIFALPTAMTSSVKERSGFMTVGTVGGSLAAALATVFLVPYAENNGYLKAAIIVAVVSFLAMSLISLFGKERYKVKEEVLEKPASLRDTWEYLIHNKYLLYFYAYRMISGSIAVSMLIYVAKYCLGDVKYMSMVVAISVIPICILFLFSGKIFKRFDKIVVYRFCMIATILMNAITLFVGYQNRTLAIACLVVIAVLAIRPRFNGCDPARLRGIRHLQNRNPQRGHHVCPPDIRQQADGGCCDDYHRRCAHLCGV